LYQLIVTLDKENQWKWISTTVTKDIKKRQWWIGDGHKGVDTLDWNRNGTDINW